MSKISAFIRSLNSIKERKTVLLINVCLLVFFSVASSFLIGSVNHVVQIMNNQIQTDVEYISEGIDTAFNSYSWLGSNTGVNSIVSRFATYTRETNRDILTNDGHEVMRTLSALFSMYGSDLNTLAVYFPGSESVVTMARYIPKEEVAAYLDQPEIVKVKEFIQSNSMGTSGKTEILIHNQNHCFLLRYAIFDSGRPVYVIIDLNLSTLISRLMGERTDNQVFVMDRQGDCFSTSTTIRSEEYKEVFRSDIHNHIIQLNGEEYYVSSSLQEFYGLSCVIAAPMNNLSAIQKQFAMIFIVTTLMFMGLLFSLYYLLEKKVFRPLESFHSVDHPTSVDVGSLVSKVSTDMNELVLANGRYVKERKQMLPLALGRVLNRLLDEKDELQQRSLAEHCLTMAGIDDSPYYAVYSVGCLEDPDQVLENGAKKNSQSRMMFFQSLIDETLGQKIFCTVAPIRKNWVVVLAPCSSKEDAQKIKEINAAMVDSFKEQLKIHVVTSDVIVDNGPLEFADHASWIRNSNRFMEFWGEEAVPVSESTSKNFLYYCNSIRILIEQVSPEGFDDSVSMLESIIKEAFPSGTDSVMTAMNRMQMLGEIAVSTISEKYKDNPELIISLELDSLLHSTKVSAFRSEFIRVLKILAQNTDSAVEVIGVTASRMAEIKEYVTQHFADNELNVSSLAKNFDYSVPYLSRCFKDVYNINLLEFIQRTRVSYAKTLLESNSVRNTASMSGFWDEQALVRTFKKYEGISPAEYKKLTAQK